MSGVNISICDGKYTVIQAPTGTTRVLRYGEEWRDVTGDNVIGGLAWELQEARDRIKRLEEALDLVRPHCDSVHHSKKHQHQYGEPCPVVAFIENVKEAKL